MPSVIVRNGNVDAALRIFKRKVNNSGILLDLQKKEEYIKPSAKRCKAKAAAKVREKRRAKDVV